MEFDLNKYYKVFSAYADKTNDDKRRSEAKTLRICKKHDYEETKKITLELIEEGLLPTFEEMELHD